VLPSLALPHAEVHLWLFPLDADDATVAALAAHLAPDELARAARFWHASDVRRYQVARGALRVLLGRYLDASPAALRFTYGPHGKPRLADASCGVDLEFNLSHSGDVALAAFSRGQPVGVDLERADRTVEALALAGRYGSAREQAMLTATAMEARSRRFIELWTCKEAWLKATGLGVTAGVAAVDIECAGARARIASLPDGQGDAGDWSLLRFEPAADYVAAVAVRDARRELGDIGKRDEAGLIEGLVAAHLTLPLRERVQSCI
jgi:4'-phosphopantetheinyl transferase